MTHILRAGVVLYHGATEFPHCATVGGARFWVGVTTSEKNDAWHGEYFQLY